MLFLLSGRCALVFFQRAQLLTVAGVRGRSWMSDIQLCREKTELRAWHTAAKEDAI